MIDSDEKNTELYEVLRVSEVEVEGVRHVSKY